MGLIKDHKGKMLLSYPVPWLSQDKLNLDLLCCKFCFSFHVGEQSNAVNPGCLS